MWQGYLTPLRLQYLHFVSVTRLGPRPRENTGKINVAKISNLILPVGSASLSFGQDNFIVGYANHPNFSHYEQPPNTRTVNLIWTKPIPEDLSYNCTKYIFPKGEMFMQSLATKVDLFGKELGLIQSRQSTGMVIGLIGMGRYAVVKNKSSGVYHFSTYV